MPSSARFRLNATTVSSHFKYRCDRRFRWNAVPSPVRGVPGTIGEGVPRPPRQDTRPGVQELMQGGDDFELRSVEALAKRWGEALVWAGPERNAKKGYDTVGVLPFDRFLDALRDPDGVRFVAQPELGYDAKRLGRSLTSAEASFNDALSRTVCQAFGLDPARVEIGLSRPDLLELVPAEASDPDPRPRLRVWDFKSSRAPKHEHFVQVAWYTFLLDAVVEQLGLDRVRVDRETGAVKSHAQERGPDGALRPADPTFDLAPYRRELARMLSAQAMGLLALDPEAAHWHVQSACLQCEHHRHCERVADETGDVARVPYLTSESRRRLVAEGFGTQYALAVLADAVEQDDPTALARFDALRQQSHDLGLNLRHYLSAAQALEDADTLALDGTRPPREAERRVAKAQVERWKNRPCLIMPSAEKVRIVVAAEQDAVSHRCYALGFRLYRWRDGQDAEVDERVFLSSVKPSESHPNGDEGDLLDAFLTALFAHLDGFDAHNRAVDREARPERQRYDAARELYVQAKEAHSQAVAAHKAASGAEAKALDLPKREAYDAKQRAYDAFKEAKQAWHRVCNPQRASVQLYVYDPLDLTILREAVERHLFSAATTPERFERLRSLARLAPPTSLLPDPGAYRSLPFTVVQSVLRDVVSLPVPYLYDLKTVSQRLRRAHRETGEPTGATFYAPYGFHWDPSNQIAFERIHDVWKGEPFVHPAHEDPLGPALDRDGEPLPGVTVVDGQTLESPKGGRYKVYTPDAVRRTIEDAVRSKLAATDSVVTALRGRLNARQMDGTPWTDEARAAVLAEGKRPRTLLPFPKNAFYLSRLFDPVPAVDENAARLLAALDTFTVLEESYGEQALKESHTAPPEDRAARFEALHDLRFLHALARTTKATADLPEAARQISLERLRAEIEATGKLPGIEALVFDAPPDARDSKRSPDDLSLLLTNADDPAQLVADEDGELFRAVQTPFGSRRKVDLLRIEPHGDRMRVFVKPGNFKGLMEAVDLGRPCVLDEAHADFNSPKVRAALHRLRVGEAGDGADHLRAFLSDGTMPDFEPFLHGAEDAYATLEARAGQSPLLNVGQHRSLAAAFTSPVSLVWGPPGTGKTHTIAHTVLALALAAQASGTPLRILVTAQSHPAIANVLRAIQRRAVRYGIGGVRVRKVVSSYGLKASDHSLGGVDLVLDSDASKDASTKGLPPLDTLLNDLQHGSGVEVVGATVWAAHRMGEAWRKAQAAAVLPTGDETLEVPDVDLLDDSAEQAEAILKIPVAPFFDTALIDEASQLKVADALVALATLREGGSIILAGDDQQLPPIIQGQYPAEAAPFLTSVFAFARYRMEARMERARFLGDEAAARADEARTLFLLDENFRMNQPLTEYPRRVLYPTYTSVQPRIRLALEPAEATDALTDALLDPERPVVLVRYAAPRAYTARNELEAQLAAMVVEALAARLLDPEAGGEVYDPERFAAEGVAVIAPHRAQNATVRRILRERGFEHATQGAALPQGVRPMPLVDTVDKAQGQEFDAVVVSYGVADEAYAEAESAFLLSKNRFNVAVTRARKKVIVLVSEAVLNVVPTDQQVLLDATMLKSFAEYCDDGEETFGWTTPEGETVALRMSWKGFDSLT